MSDTIAAIATPPGRGGVSVIRISGPRCNQISESVLHKTLTPRLATYTEFYDCDGSIIDSGIAIYFKTPHSFTGEDVLELQGHGGPVISQYLLFRILSCDVRLARPGEFSERAFLNHKMDLAQAESIADLINASSLEAARAAQQSLQGVFSTLIRAQVDALIKLRMFVEASIDFPEEDIELLTLRKISETLTSLIQRMQQIKQQAYQGTLLQEGMTIVIAGKPNAGKSSLLNYFSGKESAIVTDIPGTTRDVLKEYINLDGLPLHILDTAGLRESEDKVEQAGIRRAYQVIEEADHILWMSDATESYDLPSFPPHIPVTLIRNKIDLCQEKAGIMDSPHGKIISISVKNQLGLDILREYLKNTLGYMPGEGKFIARARHVNALDQGLACLTDGLSHLNHHQALELLAEDLRQAQRALNLITGEFDADDLLGQIFSSFCIGK